VCAADTESANRLAGHRPGDVTDERPAGEATTGRLPAVEAVEQRVPPLGALGVAIAAVSTSAILVRWSDAPSTVVAFYRVLLMTALVAPVALWRHPGAFRRISRRDVAAAVGAGVALAVHFGAWFESLRYTSVAASVTLVQSQPIFVAVGAAVLLDEAIDRRIVAGILVAVAGAAVMSLADPGATVPVAGRALFGNALAVLGAAAFAGYSIAGRSLRQRVHLFPYVTVVYGVCASALLVGVLFRGGALAGQPAGELIGLLVAYPPREWLLFLAMAVGPGIFGHTVVNWALAHLRSSVVSVTLLGEPVGSTLLAAALLAEYPGPVTVLGGAVVLAGISLTTTGRHDAE
jgi:drug/metabolite transporter (DMT)-like permease